MSSRGRSTQRSRVHTVDNVRPTWHQTSIVQGLLAFWRWLPDLIVIGTVVIGGAIAYYQLTRFRGYGETQLMLPWWAALSVITMPLVLLAAIPQTRRALLVLWWLNITRHKLRAFMAQNQIRNRDGRLPWLICIYPTKVGERAWMWLPSGLSIEDITDERDSLGPTCYAREGNADVPFKDYAHIVRIDVHRRSLLEQEAKVRTNLIGKKEDLDLLPPTDSITPDTPSPWAVEIGLSRTHTSSSTNNSRTNPRKSVNPPTTAPTKAVVLSNSGEDLSDYV